MKLSLKNSVAWLAILSLLAAYIIGQAKKGTQIITQLHNSLPQSVEFYIKLAINLFYLNLEGKALKNFTDTFL